jgi:hypothetical protein
MENNMSTELLAQFNALIAGAEASAAEAELWRETRALMIEAGYGPRITPAQIVALVPNVHGINEIVAATQEVVPASAGSKFPRRKLTPDDERTIRLLAGQDYSAERIAAELGLALKVVVTFLEHVERD